MPTPRQISQMEKDALQNMIDLAKHKDRYEELLSRDPSSPKFVFLAEILRREGDLHRATEILIKGLRSNPDSIAARAILGRIYYDTWMIDQAKIEMEKVIRVCPDNVESAKILIQIYRSEENYGKALETCDSALLFNPQDDGLKKELLELEQEVATERLKTVKTEKTRIINHTFESGEMPEQEPSCDSVVEELYTEAMANLYIDQGLYERALAVLEKIISREPENTSVRQKIDLSRSCLLSERAGFQTRRKSNQG